MEIEELVKNIMTCKDIYPPFSVECSFEDGSDEISSVQETFDLFITMVLHAFRIRFGHNIDYNDISDSDIYDMQERFKCLGFSFYLDVLDVLELSSGDEILDPGTRIHYDKNDITLCELILWNYRSEVPSAFSIKYHDISAEYRSV